MQKCKIENGFVKRFILEQKVEDICFKKKETENTETKYAETGKVERIPVEEVQLFIFDNGIALLSMLLVYENVQTPYMRLRMFCDKERKKISEEIDSLRAYFINYENVLW